MKLVDTNVISGSARKDPDPRVLAWFEAEGECALSVITLEELAYGVARAPKQRRTKLLPWFERLLDGSTLMEVTPAIARAAGELRAARAAKGRPAQQADMLIAATALVHGVTLATRDTGDFEGCGIVVEDPFAA